jgi:hypothetical protein
MTNPTSNFGWQMPTSTDLVTDLPADFEVFGQAVDTDFVDLLGGTTGQVLSKTSATDLDFTWINNDQGDITGVTAGTGISVASPTGPVPTVSIDTAVTADLTTAQTLTNKTLTSPALTTPTISTLTTNGDLLYGTGSGALARKAIGTTGQVLTVAAGIPSWATPATSASGLTFISKTTFTNSSAIAVDGVFSSTYDNYQIVMNIDSGNYGYILFQWRYAGPTTAATTNYLGTAQGYDAPGSATVKSSNVTSSLSIGPQPDVSSKSLYNFYAGSVGNTNELPSLIGSGISDLGGSAWLFGGTYRQYDKTMTGFLITPATSSYTGHITVYGMAKS